MPTSVWLTIVSFALALVLTPLLREAYRIVGFFDHPNLARKIHPFPIPRAGGIAIAVSYVATLFIVRFFFPAEDAQLALVWKVLPAAGIVFVVGIVDDFRNLKPWQKLAGQLAAAALACSSQILVSNVAGFSLPIWLSIPVTILWLLACTNAFNLLDGMDGLAAGAGLLATTTIFVSAVLQHNVALEIATLPLMGCLLGFLRYNFNPATIFLGDSGSLVIGFVLGCFGITWSQKSATLIGMTAPLIAFSIPLLDVTLAIIRRFLRHQPIFEGDRGHIHHRLLDRGMSPRKVALLIYAVCSVAAILALLISIVADRNFSLLVVLFFALLIGFCIKGLGYSEFAAFGDLLFKGGFQRTIEAHVDLKDFAKGISESARLDTCIQLIRETAGKFGLSVIGIQLAGECPIRPITLPDACWEVRIPLDDGDFVVLARTGQPALLSNAGGYFLDTLRTSLRARLPLVNAAANMRTEPDTFMATEQSA